MATIKGTDKNDTLSDPGLTNGSLDDIILGYGGDDTIYVNVGNDTVDGGGGNDKIYSTSSDVIDIRREFGDAGDFVVVRGPSYSDTLKGGDGNDLISLTGGRSVANGGEGYDLVTTQSVTGQVRYNYGNFPAQFETTDDRSAKAIIDLQRGTVTYAGWKQTVNVFHYDPPGSGNRVDDAHFSLSAVGAMNHTIRGFEGAQGAPLRSDILRGSNLTDVVEILAPGKGLVLSSQVYNDIVDGRGGIDVVSYAGELGGVDVSLSRGLAKGIMVVLGGNSFNTFRDKLTGVEGALGSRADDILRGDDGDNWFSGGAGADAITGGKGFDVVSYTLGAFGNQVGTGAAGFPWAANGTRGIELDMAAGTVLDDFGATDTLSGIEAVFGSVNGDKMRGSGKEDRFWGGDGDDGVFGLGGNDILQGGDGADLINGGRGFDTLDFSTSFPEGGSGAIVDIKSHVVHDPFGSIDTVVNIEKVVGTPLDDRFFGGNRDDVLVGRDGDDTLYGRVGDDTLLGGAGEDTFLDRVMSLTPDVLFKSLQRYIYRGGSPETYKNDNVNLLMGEGDIDTLKGVGILDGGDDNDEVRGGGLLLGGKGDDSIFVDIKYGAARNTPTFVAGGMGNDTIEAVKKGVGIAAYGYASSAVTVKLYEGSATTGAGDTDTLIKIGAVIGTRFDDVMSDDKKVGAYFNGQDGDDSFLLLTGKSLLRGVLTDTAVGGNGDDIFRSFNSGKAKMTGGFGEDHFVVKSAQSYADGGKDSDRFELKYTKEQFDGSGNALTLLHEFLGGDARDVFILRKAGDVKIDAGSGNDSISIFGGQASKEHEALVRMTLGTGRDTVKLSGDGIHARIADLTIGEDVINLSASMAPSDRSFAKIMSHASEFRGGVLIELADGDVVLQGLLLTDLTAATFGF